MASKGPTIIQSFRQGIRKLLGGSADDPKIIESASRASQVGKSSNDSNATKSSTVSSHNPFNIIIDPMSNVPERPFIPPIEKVSDKISDLESKNVNSSSTKSALDNKEEHVVKNESGESGVAKDIIINDTPESVKVVGTNKNNLKDNDIECEKIAVTDATATLDEKSVETPAVEKLINRTQLFDAMTPIRQVIKPHTPLIRFRKGAPIPNISQDLAQTAELASKDIKDEPIESSVPINAGKWKSVPVLHEWWDTPVRFKRREVDELECDIINGGGCDKIYQ